MPPNQSKPHAAVRYHSSNKNAKIHVLRIRDHKAKKITIIKIIRKKIKHTF